MKKIYRLIAFLVMLICPVSVFAATGTIKATSSSSNITLNNTFTVTVKVSSTETLGSWQYKLNYDKSKLSLLRGDTNIVGYGDGSFSSKSYSYKFKAIAIGSAAISFDTAQIADWKEEKFITTNKSGLNVKIKEAVSIVYSSDNNLASLSIDNYQLAPSFDKNVLEYSITVPAKTASINIQAKANHNKAKVSGTGIVSIVEGENILNVIVTAENKSTKTYVIKVTVLEEEPLEYAFGNTKYFIIRKLPENKPLNFNPITKDFDSQSISALYNEKLDLTLIYAKEDNEEPKYYIYDEKNNHVTLYNEISDNNLVIYLTDNNINLKGLTKVELKVDDKDITAYHLNEENKQFYVLYGVNTLTNEKGYYLYDIKNKTIQLFDQNSYEFLLKKVNNYQNATYGITIFSIILIILIILVSSNKTKYKKLYTLSQSIDKKTKEKK